MVDEGTVGDWALQGLPSDDLSVPGRHSNQGDPPSNQGEPQTRGSLKPGGASNQGDPQLGRPSN